LNIGSGFDKEGPWFSRTFFSGRVPAAEIKPMTNAAAMRIFVFIRFIL
jgi:hypothetical protein